MTPFFSKDRGNLTWEWQENALRSPIYPYLIAVFAYRPLKYLHLDSVDNVRNLPMFIHCILSALSDYCFFRRVQREKTFTFLLYMTNWFVLYMSPRCLINTIELMAINILSYLYDVKRSLTMTRVLMICLTLMRPTAILFILPLLVVDHLRNGLVLTFAKYSLLSLLLGSSSVLLDHIFYGRFTMNQINFLKFNFFTSGASHYGTHHRLWYLLEGVPTIMTIGSVPLALAIFNRIYRWRFDLKLAQILLPLTFLSLIGHKEVRFILPLTPTLCEMIGELRFDRIKWKRPLMMAYASLNIAMALYFCLVHQVGPISVAHYISSLEGNASRLLILTPCHTIPPQSFIQRPDLRIKTLSCEPNLKNESDYIDEADRVFMDFEGESKRLIDTFKPDVVVLFEKYAKTIETSLVNKYALRKRIFHSFILTHSKHDKYFNVFTLK